MQTDSRQELTHPALSAAEVARNLGVARVTVYGLMDRGELPSFRVGSVRRVRAEDLQAFVERKVNDGEG